MAHLSALAVRTDILVHRWVGAVKIRMQLHQAVVHALFGVSLLVPILSILKQPRFNRRLGSVSWTAELAERT